MVQAANLRERDDPTGFRALDWPWLRGVLVQSEMRSALVVIPDEGTEIIAKTAFIGDDDVIQACTTGRADHTFRCRQWGCRAPATQVGARASFPIGRDLFSRGRGS
jgi:hypothetical protein